MRLAAPTHISLPPRVMSLSGCLSANDLASSSGPFTPNPHTPLPYEGSALDFDTDRIRDAIQLDEGSSSAGKRSREEEAPQDTEWTEEEMEVIQATVRHPFRPLSSAFPPGELPPPRLIDELTNQILSHGLRGSPSGKTVGDGWVHGWDATRKRVYTAALDASRVAHGIEKEKPSRVERASRPGLRRVDSMDFLDQERETECSSVGAAIRLSTSLQNSAKAAAPAPVMASELATSPLNEAGPSATSSSSSSSSSLPLGFPSAPAAAPPRKKSTQRASLTRAARPASLLQRGKSYTAIELLAEGSISPQSPQSPAMPVLPHAPAPPQRPVRITRSQSSIMASKPAPHAARDSFMHQPQPKALEQSFTLDVRTSSSPSWSDSEDDDEVKPKRTRPIARKPVRPKETGRGSEGSDGSLQSPFEEQSSFL